MDAPDVSIAGDGPKVEDFYPPPGVEFYETGPITERLVEIEGRLWAMTYHAERDNIGWRVVRIEIGPYEERANSLSPGDIIELRAKVVADWGADVQVRVESPDYSTTFWAKRSAITRIHRPPA